MLISNTDTFGDRSVIRHSLVKTFLFCASRQTDRRTAYIRTTNDAHFHSHIFVLLSNWPSP